MLNKVPEVVRIGACTHEDKGSECTKMQSIQGQLKYGRLSSAYLYEFRPFTGLVKSRSRIEALAKIGV